MTKQIYISVINDLVTDNRVHKVAVSLQKLGYQVTLVGRKLPKSQPINNRPYTTKRMKLIFTHGPAFYLEYNFRLFFLLLFSKIDILLSNDLDTLLANYLCSKVKGIPIVYDSHEYFTEVPELINRPTTKKIWERLEQMIVPELNYAYTVCGSIAQIYQKKYGTDFQVVRNLPFKNEHTNIPTQNKIDFGGKKIILYQGALNIGRGLECAIKSMQYVDDAHMVIAGDGDISNQLKKLTRSLNLDEKVSFLGKFPFEEMKYITSQADLGLSIEEDLGLNYRYALPNKLFDYIQQEVPVLVSNLPEMKKVVEDYQIGMILEKHEPEIMSNQITEALTNAELRKTWRGNLETASKELCWEKEESVLKEVFEQIKI